MSGWDPEYDLGLVEPRRRRFTAAELRARDERIIRATWRVCVNTRPSVLLGGPDHAIDAIIAAAEADR